MSGGPRPLLVQQFKSDRWRPAAECPFVLPPYTVTTAPNCVVWDFDAEPERNLALARQLRSYAEAKGLPIYISASGGDGLHGELWLANFGFVRRDLADRATKLGMELESMVRGYVFTTMSNEAFPDLQDGDLDGGKVKWSIKNRGSQLAFWSRPRASGRCKSVTHSLDAYPGPGVCEYPELPISTFDLAAWPEWVEDFNNSLLNAIVITEAAEDELVSQEVSLDEDACLFRLINNGAKRGQRHHGAVFVAVGLRLAGLTIADAAPWMLRYTQNCENSSQSETEEHQNVLRSVYGREYDRMPCKLVQSVDPTVCDRAGCRFFKREKAAYPVSLTGLTAADVGKRVAIDVQVVGRKDLKALPKRLGLRCHECDSNSVLELLDQPDLLLARSLRHGKVADAIRPRVRLPCTESHRHALWESPEKIDFAVLVVRPLSRERQRFSAVQAATREVYLAGQLLPAGNKVRLIGTVVIHPGTNDITLVADEVDTLQEDFEGFRLTDELKVRFVEHFAESADAHLQIAPYIHGRDLAKEVVCLVHHSPYAIPDANGRVIRGGMRIGLLGDTREGKSEIAGDVTDSPNASFSMPFGEIIIAETARRTGAVFTINNDSQVLQWGALPLNDRGFVVIDGLQHFSSEEMGQYREALAMERVKVDMSQKGEAPMRVRLVVCFNPDKPMYSYLNPAEAILDSNPFRSPVDVTRYDLFLPFVQGDVSIEAKVSPPPALKPMPDAVYRAHVMWVFSREPEDILYATGTRELIKEKAKAMHARYHTESLPLVNSEVASVLARVSVAFACLRHSTDQVHEKVLVTEDHIKEAESLLIRCHDALGLRKHKELMEGRYSLTKSEASHILADMEQKDWDIVECVLPGRKTALEIEGLTHIDEVTVKRRGKAMVELGVLESGPRGYTLGAKGRRLVQVLADAGITASKSDTSPPKTGSATSSNDTVVPQNVALRREVGKRISAALDRSAASGTDVTLESAAELIADRFDGNTRWAADYLTKELAHGSLPFEVAGNKVVRKSENATFNDWNECCDDAL